MSKEQHFFDANSMQTGKAETVVGPSEQAEEVTQQLLNAASVGDRRTIEELYNRGLIQDLNVQNTEGETPLYKAVLGRHREVILFLVSKGADVNISTKYHRSLASLAVEANEIELLNFLEKNGADLSYNEKYHSPYYICPLDMALYYSNEPMVEFLIKLGATSNRSTTTAHPLYQKYAPATSEEQLKNSSKRNGNWQDSVGEQNKHYRNL